MSTHTPGPWKVETWEFSKASPPRKELTIVNSRIRLATLDCDFTGDNPYMVPKEEASANAAFIVRACNSHAAMLEALKDCLHNAKMRRDSGFECGPTIEREIERTELAIRLAEGRA